MMKRFKFLGALFVGLIGLVSFGYCRYIQLGNFYNGESIRVPANMNYQFSELKCFSPQNWNASDLSLLDENLNVVISSLTQNYEYCVSTGMILHNKSSSDIYFTLPAYGYIQGGNFGGGSSSCDPQYTSEECQQEYSLMPISFCNSEYCNLNGYCTFDSGECPEFSGDVSSLYINGISHISAPIIDITIPLEYQWDYMLTGNIFNLVVSGYNVDYEYIDNIIKTQRSTPDDEDLNTIVSGLIPLFVPGLVLIVFIIFIFRFIKKIF